jgi:hypothetical protein
MVFDRRYRAGLRPLFPQFLDKVYLCPDLEAAEARVEDAVSVEIDFPPVGCFKETKTLFREEPAHARMWRALMNFQNSASTPGIILKLTARRVKSVPNGKLDIIVRGVFARFPAFC